MSDSRCVVCGRRSWVKDEVPQPADCPEGEHLWRTSAEEIEEAAGAPYLDLVRRYRRAVGASEWPLLVVAANVHYGLYLHGARQVGHVLVLATISEGVGGRSGWFRVPPSLSGTKEWMALLGHIQLVEQPNEVLADQVCDLVEQAGCSYGRKLPCT